MSKREDSYTEKVPPESPEAPSDPDSCCTYDPHDPTPSVPTVSRSVMRMPLPRFDPSVFRRYVWYELDEGSVPLLAEIDADSRRAYERLGYVPGAERYEIGNFRIDEYTSVTFEMIPALGEVAYDEATEYPPGTAVPPQEIPDSTPSPMLRFLQLTDKNVPVPRMLAEFDDTVEDDPEVRKALAGRELVDMVDTIGTRADFFPGGPQIVNQPPAAAAEPPAVWTCFVGGLNTFEPTYCENKDISYCDNGAWYDLIRSTSSSKRTVSHTRIASCNVTTRVEHQYRFWKWTEAKWKWNAAKYPHGNQWYQDIPPGWVKYWRHVGNKKRRRKIHATRMFNSGYFRCWSSFYN